MSAPARATATPPAATTDLATVENDPVLADLRTKGVAAIELGSQLVVDSADRKTEGIELVARARKAVKVSEARRTALVKPHNDLVKRINDLFRDVTQPFKRLDEIVSRKVLDFNAAENRRAAEAAAKAEADRLRAEALLKEAEKAEAAGEAPIAETLLERAVESETNAATSQAQAVLPSKKHEVESGTVSVRNKPWTFRVVDEMSVPRKYLSIDSAKVRDDIRAGVREIEGLEIFQEEGLAVRV